MGDGMLNLKLWLSLCALALAYIALRQNSAAPATFTPADALLAVQAPQVKELETATVSDRVLTNIFRVEVKVVESQPTRISLTVEGEHPDGCDYPVLVEQARRGSAVAVEVFREVPPDVICPMILKPYRGLIQLDGGFEAGEYTITVNSHSQTIEI